MPTWRIDPARRAADAAALRDPVGAAERLRDRSQPEARGGCGHAGTDAHLLPREQVRGVLAHELAHVKNRDVLVTTVAAMIGAAISAVANFLQFSWLFGGDDDDNPLGLRRHPRCHPDRPDRRDDPAAGRIAAAGVPGRCHGRRAHGEGRPLANALASLERGVQAVPLAVNPATASLYIANPLSGGGMASLFSTHPPMAARIERLRELDRRSGNVW